MYLNEQVRKTKRLLLMIQLRQCQMWQRCQLLLNNVA